MSIRIDAVSKAYKNGPVAVDDVSLEVKDGEFMVLVGPSGCGNSTLLKMIAGIEETTAGTIEIGGRDVTDLGPRVAVLRGGVLQRCDTPERLFDRPANLFVPAPRWSSGSAPRPMWWSASIPRGCTPSTPRRASA